MIKLVLPAYLFLAVCSAQAWDHTGHMLVAQIASTRISQPAQAKISADLATFNQRFGSQYDFVTAACWMDDIRSVTSEYGDWHFIDIPLTAPAPVNPGTMATPNGFWLANQCVNTIQTGTPIPNVKAHDGHPIDRPQALVMLLHIVGDLHQPLHCADNGDRGGNGVTVGNMTDALVSDRNLHHLWDTAYRRGFSGGSVTEAYQAPSFPHKTPGWVVHHAAEPLVSQQATQLVSQFAPGPLWALSNPTTWVGESFGFARTNGYGQLPGGPNAKNVVIPGAYVQQAGTKASQRIVLAGFRLAALLNKLYGG
jgi:hypothetical protein